MKNEKLKLFITHLLPVIRIYAPDKNVKLRICDGLRRPRMAHLGEGLQVCDRCGKMGPRGTFVSIYFGPHGEKIDLCRGCLEKGGELKT
ncbi:MAG: hypothetical protein QW692_04225 [Nitrososphaerota archaeon]